MSMGIGLGAFAEGLAGGLRLGRGIALQNQARQDNEADRAERAAYRAEQMAIERERLDLSRNADARAQSESERAAKIGDLQYRAAASDLGAVEAGRAKERGFTEALDQSWKRAEGTYDQAIGRSIFTDQLKPAAPIPTVVPDNVRMKDAVQGPTRPGYRVGSNTGKTYATEEEAAAEAKRRYTVADHYTDTEAPRIRQLLLSQGRIEEAKAWDAFYKDDDIRQKINVLGDAGRAAAAGDYTSAVGLVAHVLNDKKYFDDGNTYGFRVARDAAGSEVGIDGFQKNDETGQMETKRFPSPEALFQAVWPLVSPDQVFMKAVEAMNSPQDREFGVIGTDQYGNEQRGFIDKRTGTVEPARMVGQGGAAPAAAPAEGAAGDPAIPPPPAGVDPKTYRTKQTEELVRRQAAEADAAARVKLAEQNGIDPKSPQGQMFVLTGKMPREDQQSLTATDKKAIFEADEMVSGTRGALVNLRRAQELSKTAFDGWSANERAYVLSQIGDQGALDTRELNNVVTSGALEQLKAIFGAAPTEGERKLLLEIQGSAELPQSVRDNIYSRAIEAAERRMKLYEERAAGLRGGDFYKPATEQPSPQEAAPEREAAAGNAPTVTSREQYEALPAGATYTAPDGSVRKKQ